MNFKNRSSQRTAEGIGDTMIIIAFSLGSVFVIVWSGSAIGSVLASTNLDPVTQISIGVLAAIGSLMSYLGLLSAGIWIMTKSVKALRKSLQRR